MMIVVLIKVASFYRKRVWKVDGEADGHYEGPAAPVPPAAVRVPAQAY